MGDQVQGFLFLFLFWGVPSKKTSSPRRLCARVWSWNMGWATFCEQKYCGWTKSISHHLRITVSTANWPNTRQKGFPFTLYKNQGPLNPNPSRAPNHQPDALQAAGPSGGWRGDLFDDGVGPGSSASEHESQLDSMSHNQNPGR